MAQADETDAHAVLQALAKAVAAILRQPQRSAWTKAEAAVKLGCTESWLEDQTRQRRIPFTLLSGALHFTDGHLAEIIALFEVRPAAETRAAPSPGPAKRPQAAPASGTSAEAPLLRARPPRRRSARPEAD